MTRTLLTIAAAMAIAVTPSVSIKQAAAAIGAGTALGGSGLSEAPQAPLGHTRERWRVVNSLREKVFHERQPVENMPPHIRCKKSWSASYKASVYSREMAIVDEYLARMETDDKFAKSMIKALGLPDFFLNSGNT